MSTRPKISGLGEALIPADAESPKVVDLARKLVDALATAHALDAGRDLVWWHEHVGWHETREVLLGGVGAAHLLRERDADTQLALALAYVHLLPHAKQFDDEPVLSWARQFVSKRSA